MRYVLQEQRVAAGAAFQGYFPTDAGFQVPVVRLFPDLDKTALSGVRNLGRGRCGAKEEKDEEACVGHPAMLAGERKEDV